MCDDEDKMMVVEMSELSQELSWASKNHMSFTFHNYLVR